ncbi:MAG: ABC transporter permease subunit [Tissierellia bacterium]|nr:ABC transporter permease subunit [Tissierellia bacterium]
MIFGMEFKSNFGKMIAWAIVLIIFVGLLLLFYPFMMGPQMKSLFDSVISSMSDTTRSILGLSPSLDYTNPGEYLAMIYHYIAILIIIFAMQIGASSLSKEQSLGNIQYIYSNPITKAEIVTQKLAANTLLYILLLVILGAATFGIMYAIGLTVETFDANQDLMSLLISIIKIFIGLLGSGLVFMSIGFFFSSLSKSSIHADAISILFIFLMVIFIILAKVLGGAFLTVVNFFPTEVFHPYNFVSSNINIINIGVNLILFVIFILLTYAIYSSKELKF